MADKSQLDKFKQAAKDAECDTDEAAFDRALKKVTQPANHTSDCAIYDGPAFEPGPCDCGAKVER